MSTAVDKKKLIMWLCVIIFPLAILCIPTTAVFTAPIRLFLAVTLCAILMFAFELLNNAIPGLLLPLSYMLLGIAPGNVAFSAWSGNVPWMIMGGLLIAGTFTRVGILKRVAYWCIIKSGASYRGILFGLWLTGLILSLAIPNQAFIPMAALTYGICIALNIGKSPEAAGIMLTGAIAAIQPIIFIYNPSYAILEGAAFSVTGNTSSWLQYFYHNAPVLVWSLFLVFVVSIMFKPKTPINGKDYFVKSYQELGPMSFDEKKAVLVSFVLLGLLLTTNVHKIAAGWCFVLVALLMYLPGLSLANDDDLRTLNFPFVIFVAGCIGIGSVASAIGIGDIVSDLMLPLLANMGTTGILMSVWFLCVALNLLMTPLAIWSLVAAPLASVALALGIDPSVFLYTIFQGTDQIFMPYEYASYLIYFSFGLIYLKDFIKLFTVKTILNAIFMVVILIPYWHLIGLI